MFLLVSTFAFKKMNSPEGGTGMKETRKRHFLIE